MFGDFLRLNFATTLCIDNTCEELVILNDVKIPTPLCYSDLTNVVLPGDGSIHGFVHHLNGNIGSSAVNVVLEKLGLAVS